jgi:hypothetical protein
MNKFDATCKTILENLEAEQIDEGIFDLFKSKNTSKIAEIKRQIEKAFKMHNEKTNDKSLLISDLVDSLMKEELIVDPKIKRKFKTNYLDVLTKGKGLHGEYDTLASLVKANDEGMSYGLDYVKNKGKLIEKKK